MGEPAIAHDISAPAEDHAAPTTHDLVPDVRTSATADRVEIVPLESAEMRAVAEGRGPVYASWLRYWQTLDPTERDPLTYPGWVAGHLAGKLAADDAGTTEILITFAGSEALTLLPITSPRPGALAHARGFGSRAWALAASDHEPAMNALFAARHAGRRVRSLHLDRVDETNVMLAREHGCLRTPIWFRSLIELDAGYEGLLAKMSSSGRNGVRRLLKRISREHAVEVEAVTAEQDIACSFARFLEVDDRSWKREDGTALRNAPTERESLRHAIHHMALEGRAVFHFLRADGVDIAAQLCAVVDRQLLVVKTSYDADWARFGAGKLLLAETMRTWCPGRAIDAINLVTGLSWHLQWGPRQLQTHELWLFARGVRGHMAHAHDVPLRTNAKVLVHDLGLEPTARRILSRLRRD